MLSVFTLFPTPPPLQELVGRRVADASEAALPQGIKEARSHTLRIALWRRHCDVRGLQLALKTYNECLGALQGQLEEKEDELQVCASCLCVHVLGCKGVRGSIQQLSL